MLRVLNTHAYNDNDDKRGNRKRWKVMGVYGLDGGDGFTGVYYPQTHNAVCSNYELLSAIQSIIPP